MLSHVKSNTVKQNSLISYVLLIYLDFNSDFCFLPDVICDATKPMQDIVAHVDFSHWLF